MLMIICFYSLASGHFHASISVQPLLSYAKIEIKHKCNAGCYICITRQEYTIYICTTVISPHSDIRNYATLNHDSLSH